MGYDFFRVKRLEELKTPPSPLATGYTKWNLVGFGIGGVIGAGIFITVGRDVVKLAQPGGIALSFALVAVVCYLVALCYAELASMMPRAGGPFIYAQASMGKGIAWLVGWAMFVEFGIANVAVAVSFGQYLSRLPWLGKSQWLSSCSFQRWATPTLTLYPGNALTLAPGSNENPCAFEHAHHVGFTGAFFNLPAFLIILLVTLVVIQRPSFQGKAQTAMSWAKVAVVVICCAVGGYYISKAGGAWGDQFFPKSGERLLSLWQASALIFFTYVGFEIVSNQAEEANNHKDVHFGLLVTLAVCGAVYIFFVLAVTGMDFPHLTDKATALPDILRSKGAPGILIAGISAGILFSMVSALLAFQWALRSLLVDLARSNFLPQWLDRRRSVGRGRKTDEGKQGEPYVAGWVAGVVVAVFAGLFTAGDALDFTNLGTLFVFLAVCVSVIILRWVRPDFRRDPESQIPRRLYPAVPLLAIVLCVSLMWVQERFVKEWFLGWMAFGIAIYFLYVGRRTQSEGK
jgi:APA family basic amino acid/polyamine antiporter